MANKPNDRPAPNPPQPGDDAPKIFAVVNGKKFPRPALETFFAQSAPGQSKTTQGDSSCNPVAATYCSCNKVCTCEGVCSCVGHRSCSCDSHTSRAAGCSCNSHSSGGGSYGCRCAPVH